MRAVKLRRLRESPYIRDWVSETQLQPRNLILPYFVVSGRGVRRPIESMPGVCRLSIDNLLNDIEQAKNINAILLFGVAESKDEMGSGAYKRDGVVQRAVRALKKNFKGLVVMTDVCMCGYTSHGHCGVPKKSAAAERGGNGCAIDNGTSLKILARIALSHAAAGADFVAPSAMMDGQVKVIRDALDKKGFENTGILGYSAKYSSSFYGPFREALGSAPRFGDRRGYQMDCRNSNEALREIGEDIAEGADIVMIKPALAYLDIICRAKEKFNVPIAAYNVSGEYAMAKGYINSLRHKACAKTEALEKELVLEMLTSIKRAGADFIITYWAKDAAGWL